jgi:hypothetical protein
MNHIQRDEQASRRQNTFRGFIDQNRRYRDDIPLKPVARVELPEPLELPPFTLLVEQKCEDCHGTGQDSGALDNDYEPCSACNGSGKETVLRQFLAEAFQIARGQLTIQPEKAHLVAMTEYARQTVSALFSEPDTKEAA